MTDAVVNTILEPYQLLPQLTGDEYAALKADIAEHGIRVPIDVDEQGRILDGHHRAAIAAELGIDPPKRVITGLTEQAKRDHALGVNVQRRILTREQRRSVIAGELTRDGSRSDREIGRLLGSDHKTVGAVRRELAGEIPHYRVQRVLAERDYAPYRPHHLLDILPLVPANEFAAIAADIRDRGLIHPITLNHDRTVILDGRIRYLACRLVHVEPRFKTLGPEYDDDEKAWGYVVAMNLVRQSLTPDQHAAILAGFEKLRDEQQAANDPETGPDLRSVMPEVGSFPTLDRDAAEALTEEIRRRLDEGDRQCSEALAAGVPPAMLAKAILRTWAKAAEEIKDAEISDAMWTHMVAPRIVAILSGGGS